MSKKREIRFFFSRTVLCNKTVLACTLHLISVISMTKKAGITPKQTTEACIAVTVTHFTNMIADFLSHHFSDQ